MRRGELFILSAPSGTGKTTLIRSMMEGGLGRCADLEFSISHTTRAPRRGEQDGVDYHFVDAESFQGRLARDEFLEWAQVHGNYYGTAKAEVFPRLERGVDVLLDLDVQGGQRVMALIPEAVGIFLMPPSFHDLERRLMRRGLDDPAEIARRLAVSLWEIRRYHHYHYVIVNDDAARASATLLAIIEGMRHRLARMTPQVEQILADFERRSPSPPSGSEEAAFRL
jgi:guanylate kinase